MRTNHRNKLMMYRTVMRVCDLPDNTAAIQTLPALVTAYADFSAKVVELESVGQPEPTKPSVVAKSAAREKLEDQVYNLANVIHAFAKRAGDEELKVRTAYSRSMLARGRDLVFVASCRQIVACAHESVAQLATYNVTPERIAAFEVELERFEAAATKPFATRSSRMTRNAQIPLLVRQIDALLKDEVDRLITEFRFSHAKFHDDYRHARIVIDIAATHRDQEEPADEEGNQPAEPPAVG